MRSVSFASLVACLLVGAACAASASAATETVSLGSNESTGAEPAPFLEPAAVESPISFTVTYTASPIQPLEVRQFLYCTRGSEHPGTPESPQTVTPPFTVTLSAPSGSETCKLAAQAEPPVMTTVFGTAKIEAEATRIAKPQAPPATKPAKKKCKKGRRLRHGKCVKKHLHRHHRR